MGGPIGGDGTTAAYDSARIALLARRRPWKHGIDGPLPRTLRWRRLLLARIDSRKRRRGGLWLGWLGGGRCVEEERSGVDRRAGEDRIAVELPVEVDIAVGRNDGLGRLA